MALFTDGPPSSIEDLAAHDSQLMAVANVEGIDVTMKLTLAHIDLEMELAALLGGADEVGAVVVTPSLKLWHTFRALEQVYSDAYNSQLNDRYKGKRDHFRNLTRQAGETVRQLGVGIAWSPVPAPETPSVMASVSPLGTSIPDGSYYVTMTWVNGRGDESAGAAPAVVTTSGTTFVVQPGIAPAAATRWNVYVGDGPETLTRQNATPLRVDMAWLQPERVATGGRPPGPGQLPNYLRPAARVLQRG